MNTREPSTPIRVLIVDDHPLIRDGLERAFGMERDIRVVGFGEDGEQALVKARELLPDVVVLDVNLPHMNGMQVARQLKTERSDIAIVILTAYHDTQQIIYAMRAGASAYCAKGINPLDLVDIIRDAAAGLYVVGEERMDRHKLDEWILTNIENMGGAYALDPDEHLIPLSPRETEILQSVTRGLSNKEIAKQLGISQQTVKNHMTSILRKLNVEDRTQAAMTAVRHGWVRLND
jgi:two-component system, NarL family, response regulator DegU